MLICTNNADIKGPSKLKSFTLEPAPEDGHFNPSQLLSKLLKNNRPNLDFIGADNLSQTHPFGEIKKI